MSPASSSKASFFRGQQTDFYKGKFLNKCISLTRLYDKIGKLRNFLTRIASRECLQVENFCRGNENRKTVVKIFFAMLFDNENMLMASERINLF